MAITSSINTYKNDYTVVEICKKCFSNNDHPIIIVGNQNNFLLKILECSSPPAVISLIGIKDTDSLEASTTETKLYKLDDYNKVAKPFPSNIYIFNEIKLSYLDLYFYKARYSVWWNLYGYYFIKNMYRPGSCDDAYLFLKIAWKFDILTAMFLCFDSFSEIQMYTFNPFTNYAPKPWKQIQIYHQENGHMFTIFKYNYKNEFKLDCNCLIYEKTLSLGGYPIRAVATISDTTVVDENKKNYKIQGVEGITAEVIWTKLNASLNLTIKPPYSRGIIYENGSVDGLLAEVLHGKFDYLIQYRVNEILWKNNYHTYTQLDLCYVYQKKLLTAQERLIKIILTISSIYFVTGYLILAIVFMYLTNVTFSQGMIDLLRSLIGLSTLREPQSVKRRIVFVSFIFIFMIANSYLQGKLYSAITIPHYDYFVSTKMDLMVMNYKIIGRKSILIRHFYDDDIFDNRFHIVNDTKQCVHTVEQQGNYNFVCVDYCLFVRLFACENSSIHVVQDDSTEKTYAVLLSRDNFSLFKRVSQIFRNFEEAGLRNYIVDYEKYSRFKKCAKTSRFSTISLDQLSLSFTLLLSGSVLSSFVFLLELIL